jgi:hypothetical protein
MLLFCAITHQSSFVTNTAATGAAIYIAPSQMNTTAAAAAAVTADAAAATATTEVAVLINACRFADNVGQVSAGAMATTAAALVSITKVCHRVHHYTCLRDTALCACDLYCLHQSVATLTTNTI